MTSSSWGRQRRRPGRCLQSRFLGNIHRLTRHIEQIEGVIRPDLLSVSTVDNISRADRE